jgi:transcriptional regulator with AAA-type ATPase domain
LAESGSRIADRSFGNIAMAEPRDPESDQRQVPNRKGKSALVASFLQRSSEPLFVLNGRRLFLFANAAWEQWTGSSSADCRGLAFKRCPSAEADSREALGHALRPSAEVLEGKPARLRRVVPARTGVSRWCDIDFFPIRDHRGLLRILARIIPLTPGAGPEGGPLPEELVTLREGRAGQYRLDQLQSQMPAFRRVVEQVRLASQTRTPLLLVGEPGTGKQWVARTIHYQSAARETAFVPLDCARLPSRTLAGLLFGPNGLIVGAGAATGGRGGAVGTLYLKEPARLPREVQDRLGGVLADAESPRSPSPARPRILAGSCGNLAEEVRAGRLLDDLYYALSTVVVELPPLRDRLAADLAWLVERLLERAHAVGEPPVTGLTPEAWELFYAYRWPGNLRELYQVLAGARARARGGQIDVGDLPAYLRLAVNLEQTPGPVAPRPLPLDQLLEEAERRLIRLALLKARGNKSRAAELLSLVYPRLFRRIEALGVED